MSLINKIILHPKIVYSTCLFGIRYRIKKLLGLRDRHVTPVIGGDPEFAFQRHLMISKLLQKTLPSNPSGIACEVGSGDCLATADLLLGSGFKEVVLIEKKPIVIRARHRLILDQLFKEGLPTRGDVFDKTNKDQLDVSKVTVIPEYIEKADFKKPIQFLFSFDVVEHIEDLPGFFNQCRKMISPGGKMVHKFDLSGHEFFEDPMPPLDFQTYPDWLYNLMFPKYRRACRRFLDEILDAAKQAGFENPSITMLREADKDYVSALFPRLRKEAKRRSIAELTPLDVLVIWDC